MSRNTKTIVVPSEPTTGLLVSMCLRDDHAFAMPVRSIGPFEVGLDDGQRRERLEAMRAAHAMALATGEAAGPGLVRLPVTPTNEAVAAICAALGHSIASSARQVYEEIVGKGFYSPEREGDYARVMDARVPADGDREAACHPANRPE